MGRARPKTPKLPPLSEAAFQRQVVELATLLGWWVFHDNDPRRNAAGLPDLLCVHEGKGEAFWAELKREGGAVRPAQEACLRRMRAAGWRAYLWFPKDWLEIEGVLGVPKRQGG